MYGVSKKNREEILFLLSYLKNLYGSIPGDRKSTKEHNIERRASLIIKKINKLKELQ